jgi:hypothetical protein
MAAEAAATHAAETAAAEMAATTEPTATAEPAGIGRAGSESGCSGDRGRGCESEEDLA